MKMVGVDDFARGFTPPLIPRLRGGKSGVAFMKAPPSPAGRERGWGARVMKMIGVDAFARGFTPPLFPRLRGGRSGECCMKRGARIVITPPPADRRGGG